VGLVTPRTTARRRIEAGLVDGPSLLERETRRADEPVIDRLPVIETVCEQLDLPPTADARLTVVAHG
jgi:hypothetical protein